MTTRPNERRGIPHRWLVGVFALLAVGCASSGPKPVSVVSSPGRPIVRLDPLGFGIWRLIDTAGEISNSLAVETATGLILADTPKTPAATRAALDKLEALTGRKAEVLFLTHFHLDRVGGASVLADRRVPIVASRATTDLLARRFAADRENLLQELDRLTPSERDPARVEGWKNFRREAGEIREVRPNRIVEGRAEHFVVGGVGLDFIFPGPGHTKDNRVLHFPGLRLLYAGCMVRDDESLGDTRDADLEAWRGSVESLLHLDEEILISGHGLRVSPNALLDTIALFLAKDETSRMPDLSR